MTLEQFREAMSKTPFQPFVIHMADGRSLAVPLTSGKLMLGTWQQIMLLEFDTRPRRRQVVIQIVGE